MSSGSAMGSSCGASCSMGRMEPMGDLATSYMMDMYSFGICRRRGLMFAGSTSSGMGGSVIVSSELSVDRLWWISTMV